MSLIIREMKIRMMMRHHLLLLFLSTRQQITSDGEDVEKR